MFDIISLDAKDKWNAVVRSMNKYDFYHLAEYHQLENSGQSLLLFFNSKKTSFALPVILRTVEGTEYNDLTSVYGYAGPLSNHEDPDKQAVVDLQKRLVRFFDENRIVSVFTRLHPLLYNQEVILSGLGEIVSCNRTVGIDLSLPEHEQRRQYAHSMKNQINRLKRRNVRIREASTKEEIDLFIEIYRENMKRVKASEMYFFQNEYFYRFLEELPSSLFLAYYEDEAISGSLFTSCNGIVQPHLSATRDNYLRWSPLKLVWDCIRINAVEKTQRWMHLGGGVGGMDDNLFQFKAQFSDLRFFFKTWQYVHNKDAYARLVSEKCPNPIPQSSFFPLYRMTKYD